MSDEAPTGSDAAPRPGDGPIGPGVRSVIVVVIAAVVLTIALNAALQAFVVVLYGALLPGLLVGAAAFVGGALVVVLVVRGVTGRWRIAGPIAATALAFLLLIVAALRAGRLPVLEPASSPVELAPVLFGTVSAIALGLFLGPLWLRVVGGVGIAAAAAFLFVPAIQQTWATSVVAQRAQQLTTDRDDAFEQYLAASQVAATTDAPGTVIDAVTSGGRPFANTVVRVGDGPEILILEDGSGMTGKDATYPCRYLADDLGRGYDGTETTADFAAWCTQDARGWTRPDGLAVARVVDGALIVVRPNRPLGAGEDVPTAAQITAVADGLRLMGDDEFRRAARETYLSTHH